MMDLAALDRGGRAPARRLFAVMVLGGACAPACGGTPVVDETAFISGTVVESGSARAIAGAVVSTAPPTMRVTTGADGSFRIDEEIKLLTLYQVTAEHDGYRPATRTITIKQGENALRLDLEPLRICVAGTTRCATGGAEGVETCAADGSGFEAAPCSSSQACVEQNGAPTCVNAYDLTVVVRGAGRGAVLSSPGGINCGTSCVRAFPSGSMVTLMAAPFSASAFAGWTGDCSGRQPACTVTMNGSHRVNADFDVTGHSVTVTKTGQGTITSTPDGIACGTACTSIFGVGETVILRAEGTPPATFVRWTGDCAGANPECALVVNAEKNARAEFMTPQFTLTVSRNGTGTGTVDSQPSGIDCGSDCTGSFDVDTMVTLTAAEGPGSTFVGWSGDCGGSAADCTVTMSRARTVTATFDGISYPVTVQRMGTGSGAVTSAPNGIDCGTDCIESFGPGQTVTLTAAPAPGSTFGSWGDACASSGSTLVCVLKVIAPSNVIATFDAFYVSRLAADGGCTTLLHFDAPSPLEQGCGGGASATTLGTYTSIASRTIALADALAAGGIDEEGAIQTQKLGPAPPRATVEMTIRKAGAAFGGRLFGVLFSDQDALDPSTSGLRLLVRNDGRLAAETRDGLGGVSSAESPVGAIVDGQWVHVAATLSSSTGISLFIDGALAGRTTATLSWAASSSTAWAGAEREGPSGAITRFNGAIDELRVSNVVRY